MDRRGRRRGPFVRAMMAVVVMLALCGLAPAQATAASPAWIRQLGTPGDDGGYVATPAPGGGIYLVAGWNTDCCGHGETLFRRYAANGDVLWSKVLPYDGDGDISAVGWDASGVYIATEVRPVIGHLTRSITLTKYSHAGDLLFTKMLGVDDTDRHPVMATDGSKVYVAWLRGTGDLGRFRDVFFGRLEEDGSVTNVAHVQSDSEDIFLGADTTSLYLANVVYERTVVPGRHALGAADLLLRRFDLSDPTKTVWYDRIGTGGDDRVVAMLVNDKGIYPAWKDDAGPGGNDEVRVQRYSKRGKAGWTRRAPIAGNGAVTVDATGVYLVGELSKAFPGFHLKGPSDAFARKFGNDGKVAWSAEWGTGKIDGAWAAAASGGTLYATGYTYGTFPGGVDNGPYDYDAFVARLR